jgi:single-strand DNA-binding protein
MLNQVTLIGHVGKDPEVRHTTGGTAVADLSLATSEIFKDKAGVKQERTEWHRVVFWDKLADIVSQYVQKGGLIAVTGSLYYEKWVDANGVEKTSAKIKAREMKLLNKREGEPAKAASPARPAPASHDLDDDIPF